MKKSALVAVIALAAAQGAVAAEAPSTEAYLVDHGFLSAPAQSRLVDVERASPTDPTAAYLVDSGFVEAPVNRVKAAQAVAPLPLGALNGVNRYLVDSGFLTAADALRKQASDS